MTDNNDQKPTAKVQPAVEQVGLGQLPTKIPPPPSHQVIEHHPPSRAKVWSRRLVLLALIGGGAGYAIWLAHRAPAIPAYIVYGNGRLEADPIDIDTKFAGRIAELRVDEGDKVAAGQVLAVMDTRDLQQTLKKGEAQIEQAQKAVEEARANLDRRQDRVPARRAGNRAHGEAGEKRFRHQGALRPAQAGARRRPSHPAGGGNSRHRGREGAERGHAMTPK